MSLSLLFSNRSASTLPARRTVMGQSRPTGRSRSLCLFISALSALALPAVASVVAAPGINGFNDPGGFTLNANTGGPDNQNAAGHGVPSISGGTLHLTTSQGMSEPGTFFGDDLTSAFYNRQQFIGSFYASFTYHYNGTNPDSFGPGNGFDFLIQNDPRGLLALSGEGSGDGTFDPNYSATMQPDAISPSVDVEFNTFTGFGSGTGTKLTTNGDDGVNGGFSTGPVNLTSGDPINVILSYNGTTLFETMTDTVTHATYNTSYVINIPTTVGSSYAYVGFSGGTGAAVSDQTITNFIFSNNVPTAPVNAGPKLTVTATASTADLNGRRTISVTVTNSGGVAADMLQVTNAALGGVQPMPNSPSLFPTTKNNLSNLPGMNTQTSFFYYSPTFGTKSLPLSVGGNYIDPNTGSTSTFSGTIRALALP